MFVYAAIVIGVFSALWYSIWGIKGLVVYLLFAGLCLTPSVVLARKMLKEDKGDSA